MWLTLCTIFQVFLSSFSDVKYYNVPAKSRLLGPSKRRHSIGGYIHRDATLANASSGEQKCEGVWRRSSCGKSSESTYHLSGTCGTGKSLFLFYVYMYILHSYVYACTTVLCKSILICYECDWVSLLDSNMKERETDRQTNGERRGEGIEKESVWEEEKWS